MCAECPHLHCQPSFDQIVPSFLHTEFQQCAHRFTAAGAQSCIRHWISSSFLKTEFWHHPAHRVSMCSLRTEFHCLGFSERVFARWVSAWRVSMSWVWISLNKGSCLASFNVRLLDVLPCWHTEFPWVSWSPSFHWDSGCTTHGRMCSLHKVSWSLSFVKFPGQWVSMRDVPPNGGARAKRKPGMTQITHWGRRSLYLTSRSFNASSSSMSSSMSSSTSSSSSSSSSSEVLSPDMIKNCDHENE